MATEWHSRSVDDALRDLAVAPETGLTEAEAARRLAAHGPNALVERGGRPAWRILADQLRGPMVLVLVIAAAVSIALGDTADALAIGAIIVLNTALGVAQELRAERAIAALRRLAAPVVRVRRDGAVAERPAADLVPGDIVVLEAGSVVPADGRLVEAAGLQVLEAILTGESEPVAKRAEALPAGPRAVGDRTNLVFKGTTVAAGRAVVAVVATGMATELGRIADLLQSVAEPPTPLQRRLAQLGRGLGAVALVIVAAVGALGLWRGEPPALVLMTALSLAVAAVPEGLPTVVTIALSIAGQRLLARRALVRRLPAVETLGSVTTICSDKTGTLTQNRMTVVVLDVAGRRFDLEAPLSDAEPVLAGDAAPAAPGHPSIDVLLTAAALCNDAVLAPPERAGGARRAVGDPTEGALVVAAARFGLEQAALAAALPRLAEVPFDAGRKRMTTVHRVADAAALPPAMRDALAEGGAAAPAVAFAKGAVDVILDRTTRVWVGERAEPLTDTWRARIVAAHDGLAASGMRVLGVALRRLDRVPDGAVGANGADGTDGAEDGLTFVGLTAMIDPPRPAAREAVARCRAAGIRPIMITGDHPLTARHIARQLGIIAPADGDGGGVDGGSADDGDVVTGLEIDALAPGALAALAATAPVFARVSPEHKIAIVEALHANGEIVAMTGDGVNDAPALRRADIGVAMGITGTDVTKEAADMVLLDDDFATIVGAIEQGRVVYDNIRRFIKYALASNAGEIWVMVVGPLLGMPLPLLPLQILWVNLVTDGLPGLALAVEPPERDVMARPPRPPRESVFGRGLAAHVVWVGALLGAACLAAGWSAWRSGDAAWQTMVFTTLTFSQMGHAMAVRSERTSVFVLGPRSNLPLFGAVLLTVAAQLAAVYAAPLQAALGTVPLDAVELAVCVGAGSVVLWAVEVQKAWRRVA